MYLCLLQRLHVTDYPYIIILQCCFDWITWIHMKFFCQKCWTSKIIIYIKFWWGLRSEGVKVREGPHNCRNSNWVCVWSDSHKEPPSTHCSQLEAQSPGGNTPRLQFTSPPPLLPHLLSSPPTKTFLPLVLSLLCWVLWQPLESGLFIQSVTCHCHRLGFCCSTRMREGRKRWEGDGKGEADMLGDDKEHEEEHSDTE